jgi:hypothetical protein
MQIIYIKIQGNDWTISDVPELGCTDDWMLMTVGSSLLCLIVAD